MPSAFRIIDILSDLSDVNTSGKQNQYILKYNSLTEKWEAAPNSGGTGTLLTYSETPPVSPNNGDFWFKSNTGQYFTYLNDGDSQQWVQIVYSSSGNSGFSGYSGTNGILGSEGLSGFSGYSGTNGSAGTSGFSGYSGIDGILGSSGFSGYSGVNGSTGTSGFSGYSGTDGILGASGFSGYSGRSGWSGIQGDKYATTSVTSETIGTGTKNFVIETNLAYSIAQKAIIAFNPSNTMEGSVISYNSGTGDLSVDVTTTVGLGTYASWSVNLSGAPGPAGNSGFSGYSGISGASGFSGYSGISGFSGYSGLSGTSGFSGYSGISGTSGFSGYSGLSGASGFSGYSGSSGFSGYSGIGTSGFSGYSGISGTSGFSGYSGISGTSGFSGYSGISGTSGFSGYSGRSGFSGYSGIGTSGFSGYSGISGTSGFSGYSGRSGFSGYSGAGSSGFSGYSGNGLSGFSGYSGSGGTIEYNTGGLFAVWYDDTNQESKLNGRVILTEVVTSIDWIDKDPGGQTDYYSVRITGWIKPVYTETYTFRSRHDDGCRLWINNTLVFETWIAGGAESPPNWDSTGTIALTAGIWYPIVIEHWEQGSGEKLEVQWFSASQTEEVIGATSNRIAYITDTSGSNAAFAPLDPNEIQTIGLALDGGGTVITTGSKGFRQFPTIGKIVKWTLIADVSGSIVIDIKKCTYSGYPTTASISASAKPTLSSVQKNTDSTLTGWTTAVAAGDIFEFVVDSASTVTKAFLFMEIQI